MPEQHNLRHISVHRCQCRSGERPRHPNSATHSFFHSSYTDARGSQLNVDCDHDCDPGPESNMGVRRSARLSSSAQALKTRVSASKKSPAAQKKRARSFCLQSYLQRTSLISLYRNRNTSHKLRVTGKNLVSLLKRKERLLQRVEAEVKTAQRRRIAYCETYRSEEQEFRKEEICAKHKYDEFEKGVEEPTRMSVCYKRKRLEELRWAHEMCLRSSLWSRQRHADWKSEYYQNAEKKYARISDFLRAILDLEHQMAEWKSEMHRLEEQLVEDVVTLILMWKEKKTESREFGRAVVQS